MTLCHAAADVAVVRQLGDGRASNGRPIKEGDAKPFELSFEQLIARRWVSATLDRRPEARRHRRHTAVTTSRD